jgi:hypothetical protein
MSKQKAAIGQICVKFARPAEAGKDGNRDCRSSARMIGDNSPYAPERKRSSNDANERDEIFAYLSVHSMTNSYHFFFLRNMRR